MARNRKSNPAFRIESYRMPEDRDSAPPSTAVRLTRAEWRRIAHVASVLYTETAALPFLYDWDVNDYHKRQLVRRGNRLFLVERL